MRKEVGYRHVSVLAAETAMLPNGGPTLPRPLNCRWADRWDITIVWTRTTISEQAKAGDLHRLVQAAWLASFRHRQPFGDMSVLTLHASTRAIP